MCGVVLVHPHVCVCNSVVAPEPRSSGVGTAAPQHDDPTPAAGDRLTLDASNHTIAYSYERFKMGDVVAFKQGAGGFEDLTVVQHLCHSRYHVTRAAGNTLHEIDLNQGNSYRPILTPQVSLCIFGTSV